MDLEQEGGPRFSARRTSDRGIAVNSRRCGFKCGRNFEELCPLTLYNSLIIALVLRNAQDAEFKGNLVSTVKALRARTKMWAQVLRLVLGPPRGNT